MGTSTRNSGQSPHTPLVPSWLTDEGNFQQPADGVDAKPTLLQSPIPPEGNVNRFRGPRSSFTQYVSGGGRDSDSMRRAVSRYVSRSLGGSVNATQRLGSARRSAARLFNVVDVISKGTIDELAHQLSIDNIKGLSATDFFLKIAEFICPYGGPNDEGMARAAFYDAVADDVTLSEKSTEDLSPEDCEAVLQSFMGKVIMEHLLNDVVNGIIVLPDNVEEVSHIEEQIEQLIIQNISDAWQEEKKNESEMTSTIAQEITDKVYQKTYAILQEAGE